MKESKEFKMLNEKYLSCNGRPNRKLINFHKNILKKYLRPLGANSPGDLCQRPPFAQFRRQTQILSLKILNVFLQLKFLHSLNLNKIEHFSKVSLSLLESYLGLRMVRSPLVKMLNLPKIEIIYLIQPVMNIFYRQKDLNNEKKPSGYQSFEAVEGQGQELLLKTKRKAISGGSPNLIKNFLSINKHKYIHRVMESLCYNRLKLMQHNIYSDSGTSSAAKTAKSAISPPLPDQQSSSFLQKSARIYPDHSFDGQPIPHIRKSFLKTHKFIPGIDTRHTRMKKQTSSSPLLIFVERHQNSKQSFKIMRTPKNTNSRADVRSYPIDLGPSGLTAQTQYPVDYEVIADRVYDIIENRLRIEKERE